MGKLVKNRDRMSYIGGTDLAPICGASVFKTREQLKDEKLGRVFQKENASMRRGKAMERHVRKIYKAEYGLETLGPKMLRHPTNDWLVANLDDHMDGLAIEYKTASAWSKNWKDGPPADYIFQVQHYMAMLGVQKADLFVLFSTDNFKEALAQIDAGVEDLLLDPSKYTTELIKFEFDQGLVEMAYKEAQLFWDEIQKERENANESNGDNGIRGDGEGPGANGGGEEGQQQPAL